MDPVASETPNAPPYESLPRITAAEARQLRDVYAATVTSGMEGQIAARLRALPSAAWLLEQRSRLRRDARTSTNVYLRYRRDPVLSQVCNFPRLSERFELTQRGSV